MGEVTRVPLALLIAVVATFAEMRCAKAKPYRDGAAVAALVLQVVRAVLRADLGRAAGAARADELGRVVVIAAARAARLNRMDLVREGHRP